MDGPFCGSNQSNEVQQYVNCQDDNNSDLPISYGCNEKNIKITVDYIENLEEFIRLLFFSDRKVPKMSQYLFEWRLKKQPN